MVSGLLALSEGGHMAQLQAAPALRQVITLTQPDGSTLQVLPVGDEHYSYYIDAATQLYVTQDEETHFWRTMTKEETIATDQEWKASRVRAAKMFQSIKKLGGVPQKSEVKLPVFLVQFSDTPLSQAYGTKEFYDAALNDLDHDRVAYVSNNREYHTGSIRKYWNDQSLGKFDPHFDVFDVITLKHDIAYYGQNVGSNKDAQIDYLFKEVVDTASARGYFDDLARYDNDGNKVLDCIYIVFAGKGENEGAGAGTIWAKCASGRVYNLSGGYRTNLFMITPELSTYGGPCLGVFAHEFGHTLGLPDFYSTNSSTQTGCYGMDAWSLMDQGSYNGRDQIPASLTAHERMSFGWIDEPDEIPANGVVALPPFGSTGKALIMRNEENPNEYVTIENHQPGDNLWDKTWGNGTYYAGTQHAGLLITYVNYDASIWSYNTVNADSLFQRCSPIAADGEKYLYRNFDGKTQDSYNLFRHNLSSDIFPGKSSNTKLNSSNPYFHWHNGDTIAFNIENVVQRSSGNVDITFSRHDESGIEAIEVSKQDKQKTIKRLYRGQIYIEQDGRCYDILGREIKK